VRLFRHLDGPIQALAVLTRSDWRSIISERRTPGVFRNKITLISNSLWEFMPFMPSSPGKVDEAQKRFRRAQDVILDDVDSGTFYQNMILLYQARCLTKDW
jgi:hypothetical protein